MRNSSPRFAGATLLLVLTLPLGRSAFAADAAGHFVVKGAGTSSCSDYAGAYEDKAGQFLLYLGWLGGYLTAVNEYRSDTYDIAAWENVGLLAGYLEAYCRRNPDQGLAEAARRLVVGLAPERRRAQGAEVAFKAGAITVELAPEVVAQVKARLTAFGRLPADADETAFQDAIAEFQQAQGLPKTRLPDQQTLHALFRGGGQPSAE